MRKKNGSDDDRLDTAAAAGLPVDPDGRSPDGDWSPERLYRKHESSVRAQLQATARKLGVSEAELDIEGIVQSSFAAAYQQRSKIRRFLPWLSTVARREMLKEFNEVVKRNAAARQGEAGPLLRSGDTDPVYTNALAHAVVDAIAQLPPQERKATYLRLVKDWSTAEIAKEMGIKPGTVSALVHSGKTKVKERMSSFVTFVLAGVGAGAAILSEERRDNPIRIGAPVVYGTGNGSVDGSGGDSETPPAQDVTRGVADRDTDDRNRYTPRRGTGPAHHDPGTSWGGRSGGGGWGGGSSGSGSGGGGSRDGGSGDDSTY